MNLKKFVSGLLLSSALAAGVGVSVASFEKVQEPKEVEAAGVTFAAGTKIYLAGTGDITITGCNLSAWVWYSSGSKWESFDSDSLSGYYMITLREAANGLTFARTEKGSDGGDKWSDVGTVYNKTDMNFESGKNWIWPVSWPGGDGINCSWKYITYHVAGSFSNPTWQGTSATYKMTDGVDDSGNHQAAFTLTTTNANEQMKCTANYNGTVPGDNWYGTLASGYNTKYVGTSGGNILLKVAGTYEIYLKADRTVWVQISSATEADDYAQTFLSSITCTSESVTSALDVWNEVAPATTSMEYKFKQLTLGAQNVLKGATPSQTGSNVEKCIARYVRILSKYGYGTASGQYHDFMELKPARLGGSAIVLNSIVNGTTGTSIAIIAISTVSLAAIGGYFLFRKKKEN